jgi:hypothetical protein
MLKTFVEGSSMRPFLFDVLFCTVTVILHTTTNDDTQHMRPFQEQATELFPLTSLVCFSFERRLFSVFCTFILALILRAL